MRRHRIDSLLDVQTRRVSIHNEATDALRKGRAIIAPLGRSRTGENALEVRNAAV